MEAKRVRDRYGDLRCSNCEQRVVDTQNLQKKSMKECFYVS